MDHCRAGPAFVLLKYVLVRRAPRTLTQRAIGKTERRVDLAALVTRIRELSRLETASMRSCTSRRLLNLTE
jgi:hypothetical protein